MGGLVADKYVPVVQTQLNFRFSPGDQLNEMVAIQQEFAVFSGTHSLRSVASILNAAPAEDKERLGWFTFLDNLRNVGSDTPNVNGHDRIIAALKQNLESETPHPVFFTWHSAETNSNVLVSTGNAYVFSQDMYIIISAPIGPSSGP